MNCARRVNSAVRALVVVAAVVAVGCSNDARPEQASPPNAPPSPVPAFRPAPPTPSPPAAAPTKTPDVSPAGDAADLSGKLAPDADVASQRSDAAPATDAGVREVRLKNGSKARVRPDGQVLIVDRYGNINAESYCDPGEYDRAAAFMRKLQSGLRAGNKAAVAELVIYPLRINRLSGVEEIATKADLIAGFSKAFSPNVRLDILSADPGEVFCNTDGIMWGAGVIWVDVSGSGELGVYVINRGGY